MNRGALVADESVRKRLGLFLNDDAALVDKYIEKFGERVAMKNIKALRDDFDVDTEEVELDGDSGLESPIYTIKVTCPVCGTVDLNSQALKAKSLVITNNRFFAPTYSGASGFQSVDYNRCAVTACNKCYFASPDRNDFITFSNVTRSEKPSQLSRIIINELEEETEDRRVFFDENSGTNNLFEPKKDIKQSILSYRLAIMRAQIEIIDKGPYAAYKAGSYALKIALFEQMQGNDDTPALKEALDFYKVAFENSDYPSEDVEYRTCYVIAALLLRVGGREKEARQFMSVLDRIKSELEQDTSNPSQQGLLVSINRWKDTAQNLWDDREYEDLWDLPKPPK
ncbi:MAG: DUF2225 domain-containing protein [Fibrobacterales bacterium]